MAISNRASALAIMTEVTEGTPVAPSSNTDFVALKDDATMSPSFDVLDNNELKNSLGASETSLGLENPTFSMGHFLRHSGTEGQKPNYSELIKTAFGTETVNASERATDVGSTVSNLVVTTGATDFPLGTPILIKDATNGYSIRPSDGDSGTNVPIGFDLSNAPASTVTLGKAVAYSPANSGHDTLSIWHYLGNGGALQMMAGARVVSMDMTFSAGQFIESSYSLEGISYSFNPIDTTTNNAIDFDDGGAEQNVSVTQKVWKDPKDLAEAIATAMNAATSDTITVTYVDGTGKYTIASDGGTLNMLWNSGTNTATSIGQQVGFLLAADDTGSVSYVGDNAITVGTGALVPTVDSTSPLVAKNNVVFIGDSTDNVCFEASSVSVSFSVPKTDILSVCSATGKSGSIINGRTAEVSVTALLSQYESEKFHRFHTNQTTKFLYNFGSKDGAGNWEAGKSGMVYSPTTKISSFSLGNADQLVSLDLTLSTFVPSNGDGEIFLGFV